MLAVGICSQAPAAAVTVDGFAPASINYREVLLCGANSMYLFLLLAGHPEADISELKAMPLTPDGTSLLTLRDAAAKYGVLTEVRLYRPDELSYIPLPAIAQFRTSTDTFTRRHFSVLYRIDADNVYLLEGTTGQKYVINRPHFAEIWTGYVLAERPSGFPFKSFLWPEVPLALIFLGEILLIRHFLKRRTLKQAPLAA